MLNKIDISMSRRTIIYAMREIESHATRIFQTSKNHTNEPMVQKKKEKQKKIHNFATTIKVTCTTPQPHNKQNKAQQTRAQTNQNNNEHKFCFILKPVDQSDCVIF